MARSISLTTILIASYVLIPASGLEQAGTWTERPHGQPVIDRGESGAWDAYAVDNPFIFSDAGKLYCFYEGQDKAFKEGGHERVGMAVSEDGLLWTKSPANPILEVGPAGSWDSVVSKLPVVTRRGETYYLFYSGRDGTRKQLGLATSTDLVTWTKHPDNPILPSRPDAWDKQLSTHPASPFERDGRYYLLYRGMSRLYADQGLGVAVSTDLIHWTRATDEPVIPTDKEIASLAISEMPGGYVALAQAPERTYWTSSDLLTWQQGGPTHFSGPNVDTVSNPVHFRGEWVVFYEQQDRIFRAVLK